MNHLKGLFAVLLVSGIMWSGWSVYRDFLYNGQKPPESTKILNELKEKGIPDFELKDLNGNMIRLSNYKDKVVIVNFWASWCDPCVEEFPALMALVEHFKGRIVMMAISADNTEEDMKNFLKAFKVDNQNIIVMWDKEQNVAKKFGTQVLPESYILGINNKLVRKVAGVDDWSSPYAKEFFENLLMDKNP
ncbi:MAG: redoxin domain-containing protein [Bdellovibrionaceae bacterium]|nr:redoxin domain-containing protein [Pseudobdellovibrionaceae bacterium]